MSINHAMIQEHVLFIKATGHFSKKAMFLVVCKNSVYLVPNQYIMMHVSNFPTLFVKFEANAPLIELDNDISLNIKSVHDSSFYSLKSFPILKRLSNVFKVLMSSFSVSKSLANSLISSLPVSKQLVDLITSLPVSNLLANSLMTFHAKSIHFLLVFSLQIARRRMK